MAQCSELGQFVSQPLNPYLRSAVGPNWIFLEIRGTLQFPPERNYPCVFDSSFTMLLTNALASPNSISVFSR
jgi:hypothetical protein